MKYNRLGRTGLFVSEICFGTMTFSGENFFGGAIGTQDQKEANGLIEKCVAAGVNFIDTADAYSAGKSEIITGQAIKDLGLPRSEIVLATKVFGPHGQGRQRYRRLPVSYLGRLRQEPGAAQDRSH